MYNGVVWRLYPDGTTRSQELFVEGELHGRSLYWRPNNGPLMRSVEYLNGKRHGETRIYSQSGKIEQIMRFDQGEMTYHAKFDERGLKYSETSFGKNRERARSLALLRRG